MRVRRLSTPSPRSAASESVWGFAFALLAGSRRAGAAVAVIVASILMTGAPAAVAVEATGAPQTAGAPSTAPHVHGPPAAPDDLRAQQTPTPDDEIPDVALTLGGASHTVDVEGYFTDRVIRYQVSGVAQRDRPHLALWNRDHDRAACQPELANRHGHRRETLRSRRAEAIHRHRVGDGRRSHGDRQHRGGDRSPRALRTLVTASDYFEGEGAMYTAESSDPAVATVAVDGAVVTVTAVAAGSATVTVTATSAGGSAEQSLRRHGTVPPAPAAVGSIEAATLTEGATHMVTASDYFVRRGGDVHGGILERRASPRWR